MADEIITATERTLFEIIAEPAGELVGVHEDRGVAIAEIERLDGEAGGQLVDGQAVHHRLAERVIIATDDPDDGQPNLQGPVVSSGNITMANLERGDRPEEVHVLPAGPSFRRP